MAQDGMGMTRLMNDTACISIEGYLHRADERLFELDHDIVRVAYFNQRPSFLTSASRPQI